MLLHLIQLPEAVCPPVRVSACPPVLLPVHPPLSPWGVAKRNGSEELRVTRVLRVLVVGTFFLFLFVFATRQEVGSALFLLLQGLVVITAQDK